MIDEKIIIEETITNARRCFYEALDEIRLTENERYDLKSRFDELFELIEKEIINKKL